MPSHFYDEAEFKNFLPAKEKTLCRWFNQNGEVLNLNGLTEWNHPKAAIKGMVDYFQHLSFPFIVDIGEFDRRLKNGRVVWVYQGEDDINHYVIQVDGINYAAPSLYHLVDCLYCNGCIDLKYTNNESLKINLTNIISVL